MSSISKFDFLLSSNRYNNNKSIILAHDDNTITIVSEIHIPKPFDINTLKYIGYDIGGVQITSIPIKLLTYMDYLTESDEFYKIKIPTELFFKDKNFVGFPMGRLQYHDVEFLLKSSNKQDFKILVENVSLTDGTVQNTIPQTLDYTTSDYIAEKVYSVKKIKIDYMMFCTGFFIASRKLPSKITITLDGNIFFEYDEWMYKYCGIHLCGDDDWTQTRFNEVYPLVADSGINHYIFYNIIEMTRPNDSDMVVYWIPFKPHQKWDVNSADTGIDFARINEAFITFPEEFRGTLYFLYHNQLRIASGMGGLRYSL